MYFDNNLIHGKGCSYNNIYLQQLYPEVSVEISQKMKQHGLINPPVYLP